MRIEVLGRTRYYYARFLIARLRRMLFRLQGLDAIITTVHIRKDGTAKPFYIGNYQETKPPEDVLHSGWYRVIPYHPTESKGNWSRSCV